MIGFTSNSLDSRLLIQGQERCSCTRKVVVLWANTNRGLFHYHCWIQAKHQVTDNNCKHVYYSLQAAQCSLLRDHSWLLVFPWAGRKSVTHRGTWAPKRCQRPLRAHECRTQRRLSLAAREARASVDAGLAVSQLESSKHEREQRYTKPRFG